MSKTANSLVAFVIGARSRPQLGIFSAPMQVIMTRDKLSFKVSIYKKRLESLVDDLVEEKNTHLNEAKN